jgi:hypothetical protein
MKLSTCCWWPPTDDSESVCSRCREHATFEEEHDGSDNPTHGGHAGRPVAGVSAVQAVAGRQLAALGSECVEIGNDILARIRGIGQSMTDCARCDGKGSENIETRRVIHFRQDGGERSRTLCDLLPREVAKRHELATCVGESVNCAPCLAAVEARHRQRELDDFYALDMERDTGEPFWDERGPRREAREHRETID